MTFFLSFVPYVGLVLAVAPAVLLALAEFGLTRAVLVIAGVTVINILAEKPAGAEMRVDLRCRPSSRRPIRRGRRTTLG